jgi:hypothetical protein
MSVAPRRVLRLDIIARCMYMRHVHTQPRSVARRNLSRPHVSQSVSIQYFRCCCCCCFLRVSFSTATTGKYAPTSGPILWSKPVCTMPRYVSSDLVVFHFILTSIALQVQCGLVVYRADTPTVYSCQMLWNETSVPCFRASHSRESTSTPMMS